MNNELQRFLDAQKNTYQTALFEVRNGQKRTHWMWFIFPQVRGLGFSDTAKYYAIGSLHEATEYLEHPLLGKRLVEISSALLGVSGKTATTIFGTPDDLKLCSSMTLFSSLDKADPVFNEVINKYFNGKKDDRTLSVISKNF